MSYSRDPAVPPLRGTDAARSLGTTVEAVLAA